MVKAAHKFFLLIFFTITACSPSTEELMRRAEGFRNSGKCGEAIAIYSDIIKDNHRLQSPIYNRGLCYHLLKDNRKALEDFNTVIGMHEGGRFVFHFKSKGPLGNDEGSFAVSYPDVVYQRAQTLYDMDSLESSFEDFERLIEEDFEKTHCLIWQGMIWLKSGKKDKACHSFGEAQKNALDEKDRQEADKFYNDNCK